MSGAGRGRLAPAERVAARAWETVAAGGEAVTGVRPEIVDSWIRCRDDFGVEPTRERALPAEPDPLLAPEEACTQPWGRPVDNFPGLWTATRGTPAAQGRRPLDTAF